MILNCKSLIHSTLLYLMLGEPLTQRADDHPDTVAKRLQNYQSLTTPLLDYYDSLKLLKSFTGTESDKIWPEVNNYIQMTLS